MSHLLLEWILDSYATCVLDTVCECTWNVKSCNHICDERSQCGSKYVITYVLIQEWYSKSIYMSCVSQYHTHMYPFTYMSCKYHLGQLTWVAQKLSFAVSTLLSSKLQWDRADLSHFHGNGCDFHGPIMANQPKFIHKVIGCQVSTPKFTQDLQRFSKFQVPNHQFFCEVPKRGKGLAVQKPGKSPNRQISNLRHRYGYIKSQKRTSRKIIKCQDWGRFVRNPLLRLGIQSWIRVPLSSNFLPWRAARHFIFSFKISTQHFFQLQRLVSSSISLIFKPWQPCCIRTTSTHLAWHCHDFEFQIRKAKPENCATPSGRSMEYYGWLWYEEICSDFCIFVAWTITYLAQRAARKMEACTSPMPYAHNVSHSRRNFQILWEKKARIQ